MPPVAHRITLQIPITEIRNYTDKPSHAAILYYLVVRQKLGLPGATRAELVEEVGMSERTTSSAVNQLLKAGTIA